MNKFRTKMREMLKGEVCLALAVCMMLCMIPAAGAEETETTTAPTYEYVFTLDAIGAASTATSVLIVSDPKPVSTSAKGKWTAICSESGTIRAIYDDYYKYARKSKTNTAIGANGTTLKITVDEAGTYKPTLTYYQYKSGGQFNVYLVDAEKNTITKTSEMYDVTSNANPESGVYLLGSFESYNADIKDEDDMKSNADYKICGEFSSYPTIELKKQDYYLVFALDSANSDVTQAEDYTDGTTALIYYINNFALDKVENVTEEPETVTAPISFVATSNVGEGDMMNVEGFTYDEFTDSIPAGTYVTVTPKEYTGYEFKHWVRGSADNGVYVSDNPTYSFTALTHTFLTAIYEDVSNEDDTTAIVEFYNGNGQYLSKATSTVGETVALPTEEPEMTGFKFANQWRTEDGIFDATTPLVKKLTRAVAQFNTPSDTFTVTCGEEEASLTYGSKHTFTSDSDVYWLRDETVVGYGKEYTHAAWDATEITTSETGELVPVVLLDDTKKDGAYMIEYNAAGKEILEVGIVFGNEGVNIGSCSSKATSQYKNQHGQFTAKPYSTETTARGYMIYKEDNTYKVVYSK